MATTTLEFGSTSGLHARPASLFAQAADASGTEVTVATAEGSEADGASLLAMMSLGVKHGDQLTLTVTGQNEDDVLAELAAVLATNHDA